MIEYICHKFHKINNYKILREEIMNLLIQSIEDILHQKHMKLMATPNDLNAVVTDEISILMNSVLGDVFALYLKTKNYHWYMNGAHFHDYHLLLDEQVAQIFSMIDPETHSFCITTKKQLSVNTLLRIFNVKGFPLLDPSVSVDPSKNFIYNQLLDVNMIFFFTRKYSFSILGIFRNPNEEIMTPSIQSRENVLHQKQTELLATPTDLKSIATDEISFFMNSVLADVFALYLKTKNFHWHMSGPHFRDYHLLLDGQAGQLLAMTDPIAERIRKLGGTTLRSIGHISRTQQIIDNDENYVNPIDMLSELRDDNKMLVKHLRETHARCNAQNDIASASLIETWIDQTEERIWFLFEVTRSDNYSTF